jgi:hypothetical protein
LEEFGESGLARGRNNFGIVKAEFRTKLVSATRPNCYN